MEFFNLKFRTDLTVSQQNSSEETVFIIKDPINGRFYRLKEAEYFIAQQLDGGTALQAIRKRVEEKFGVQLSEENLSQFVEKLRGLGLLVRERTEVPREIHSGGRVRGSLLYLRFKIFDPDSLFDFLIGKIRFFFSRPFLWCSATAIAIAILITISKWPEIQRDFAKLFHLQALALAWITILSATTAHEFAHGLACKYFGGKVNELGFMLIYFNPAMYCNVSDAWLFPEKAKRLWVTFAGAYLELVIWALATLTWRVTDPNAFINYLALVIMAGSGIKVFFNLNPLIKLDGYYLLSDYVEIPNLRLKAFGYIGRRLRRLGPGEISFRERNIYLIYGLLAGAYSFLFLGFIALKFGGFLIGNYEGLGFLLFLLVVSMFFKNSLRKLWVGASSFFRPTRLSLPTPNRPVKIFASLTALGLILFFVKTDLKVSGEFKILPAENTDVRAQVEGLIEEVFVDDGDEVKKGDVIVRLSSRDYRADFLKTEAEIAEKRAKLKMLRIGPRREEIEVARRELQTAGTAFKYAQRRYEEGKKLRSKRLIKAEASVAKIEERVKYAKADFKRLEELFLRKLISRRDFEKGEEELSVRSKELEEAQGEFKLIVADDLAELRQDLAVAQKQLKEAESRLSLRLAGSRPEEIEAVEAEIARLKAQKNHLTEEINLTSIISPISGVVTTPDIKEKHGEHVNKGDLIAEVYDMTTIRAEIPVPEKEIADVQVRHRVRLKARAYPGKTFHGIVKSIAPIVTVGEDPAINKTVLVKVELVDGSRALKPEMTGNAKIYCGKRPLFDILTRRLVRFIKVEFWSWW